MRGPHKNPRTIRSFIRENPHLTTRAIAEYFEMNKSSISRHIRLMNGVHPGAGKQHSITCREPLRTLFIELSRQGHTDKSIARELDVSNVLISAWRNSRREPSFFAFECLCTLAKFSLKLEPQS